MAAEAPVGIVTAASKGMGAAVARALAARGWRLALLATSDEVERLGRELGALAVRGSVTEAADLERLVKTTLDRHGRIDGVLNNTGHPPKGDLIAIPDADWHKGLDMLLLNVVRMARLVTPVMEGQASGAILNVSTFAAREPDQAFPVSSALRAALSSFTKLYAQRYGAKGIRMNNLLPGFIDSYPSSPERIARIPAGRFGTVAEVGATAAFLLSPEAAYISGQDIAVDGGLLRGI